jgi:CHAT domain-containing protein
MLSLSNSKFILIQCLLVFSFNTISAQSWSKSKQLIENCIVKNEFLKAEKEIAKVEKKWKKYIPLEQYAFYNLVSDFYKNQEQFPKALAIVEKQFQLTQKYFLLDKKKLFEVDLKYVDALRNNENFKLSRHWFDTNIERMKLSYGELSIELAQIYTLFATILSENGDFERTFSLIDNVLHILENNATAPKLGNLWKKIGYIYYNFQDFENAIKYYQKALHKLTEEEGSFSPGVATLLSFLGEAYHDANQGDLSLEYSLKALKIVEEKGVDIAHLHYYCNAVGSAYFLKEDYTNAVKYYKKGAALSLPFAWTNLARTYKILNKYELAHAALDSSYLLFNYKQKNIFDQVNYPGLLIHVMDLRSDIYFEQYLKTQDLLFLQKCELAHWETNQLCLFNIASFDKNFNKKIYYNQAIKFNNKAINVCFDLFEKSKDSVYLEKIFYYSEINKSLLLLDNIIANKTQQLADIPYELELNEATLKQEITTIEKESFEKKNADKINNRLFTLRENYSRVRDSIGVYCKDFNKNDYRIGLTNTQSIRNALDSSTTIVDFSIVDSQLYTIVLNRDTFDVLKQKIDTFFGSNIIHLTQNLAKINENEYASSAAFINKTSFEYYKKLLQPIANLLHKNIIFITSGALDFLPFDVLLTETTDATIRFHQHPFLIKKHSISYNYSANMWKEALQLDSERGKERLLAIAPFSDFEQNGFLEKLPSSSEEVTQIAKIIQGKTLLDNAANKTDIVKIMGSYRILHFATHGKSNDQKGEYSYIALQKKDSKNAAELLYAKEIYNIPLKAEMVVLSACETGIGEAQQGEGLISIAHALTYSGAKSVLTTLWSVNDTKTKEIMIDFYKNLQLGYTKDEALQQTKIKYLNKNKDLKSHPFYWSGFKLIGNSKAIH